MNHISQNTNTLIVALLLIALIVACRVGPAPKPQPSATLAVVTEAPTPAVEAPPTPTPEAHVAVESSPTSEKPSPTPSGEPVPTPVAVSFKAAFAPFDEPAVKVEPALAQQPVAPDLENVSVPFILSPAQRERLERDGVVVSPGVEKEFFTQYEKARYANVPIFVTSDSLLHVYHLLFDKTLRTAEVQYFIPLLRDLNEAMLAATDQQYQSLKDTGWEDAARRTVAFVGVASRLLDPDVAVPGYAADLVEAELALIEAANAILPSPIFPGLEFGEDYTQYIPRGHYTKSDALKAYFKSMMWYGRLGFRLKTPDPEVGRAETRSALLLTYALRNAQVEGRPAMELWADLYNPTVFFVGRSDDLMVTQYAEVMDAVYGPDVTLTDMADDGRLDAFIKMANQLPAPRILGMVIRFTDDEEEMTKGFRFMGQRFVPDAYIFRQLIWRNVGEATENRRGLPKGLDVPAAMGSDRAYQILDDLGDTKQRNYPQQMQKVQEWMSGLSVEEWTETLYNTWLYTFHPLLEVPVQGYPDFTQSVAWQDKQLNTVLGSWAELKHDTILYAKQVYAEMGGGGPSAPDPIALRGYVEPVPHFYARLTALTAMTREGLESRGMLTEQDMNSLQRLEELSRAFQTMAEKELRGEALTEEEYSLIRFYGGELEHLTMAAADTDTDDPRAQPMMDEEPQVAVIADVATDPDPDGNGMPNPIVLEVGVGRVNDLYAVVPMAKEDGTIYLQVAKGGVFSYYEFPWPADDRLTDEKWREMLDEDKAPPLLEWTASFLTDQTEHAALQETIYQFEKVISSAFWELNADYLEYQAGEQGRAELEPEIEALREENHYLGRQLVNRDYRSFDRQSDTLAVVTVRETWQDSLYDIVEYPGDWMSDPVAERGPYTLDVTYTLEQIDERWQITRVVYANQPPSWE
jgi:hypothetical protein